MCDTRVVELGRFLMRSVREIDLKCNRLLDGVEYGLCNINRQFREDVEAGVHPDAPITRTGRRRKLSCEPATVWMLYKRLPSELVVNSKWEEPYPASPREKCDLVAVLDGGIETWVEVKFAWKSWFNCIGGYETNSEFMFQGYLMGSYHSHSAADDFVRLTRLAPATAYRGVLLIGFDSTDAPMDKDITVLESQAAIGWRPDVPLSWDDRRDSVKDRCRINCWFWWHPPKAREALA
jgi:hypothetical protein